MSNDHSTFIGIDIAKCKCDFFASSACKGVFPNSLDGIGQFIALCQQLHNPCVICEATGGYEQMLLQALSAHRIRAKLVNPLRVRRFIESEGIKAKTDKIDARLLQRFGQTSRNLIDYVHPPAEVAQLRSLLDLRQGILTALQHIREQAEIPDPIKAPFLQEQQDFFAQKLAEIESKIESHIQENQPLREKAQRLRAVKGVGPVLAATLLGFLPELGKIDNKILSSLVGVAPHPHDSGSTHKRRHVKRGRQQIKKVLYMGAVSSVRYNPILKEFYNRLRNNGKPALVALVAVMRKMLCLFNKIIANPNFVLAS